MRIGLFTDTYHPTVNGITYVIDETRRELQAMGHEVVVVCPATKLRRPQYNEKSQILRIPAIKDVFFEDQMTSFFFPPSQLKRIRDMRFDVIQFTTPGQIGMLGVYAALKNQIPLVAMYCTDLYQTIRHYPRVVPAVVAHVISSPITLGARAPELGRIIASLPGRSTSEHWSQKLVAEMLTILHNRCQAIVAPSQKVRTQLLEWGTTSSIHVIPTGLKPLEVNSADTTAFRQQLGISSNDKVILSVGRLSSEKNVELLIKAFDKVKQLLPSTKLVIVGNSSQHQPNLIKLASKQLHGDDIIFSGNIERNKLGAVYNAADLFVFTSMNDTQGLVLHEAAQLGLPLVVCDPKLSEILEDGVNGYLSTNDAGDLAEKITSILADPNKTVAMGVASVEIVSRYSSTIQASKLLRVYEEAALSGVG